MVPSACVVDDRPCEGQFGPYGLLEEPVIGTAAARRVCLVTLSAAVWVAAVCIPLNKFIDEAEFTVEYDR